MEEGGAKGGDELRLKDAGMEAAFFNPSARLFQGESGAAAVRERIVTLGLGRGRG